MMLAASADGLVTLVSGTETWTKMASSTLYLPASLRGNDKRDRVGTICYKTRVALVTLPAGGGGGGGSGRRFASYLDLRSSTTGISVA